MKQIAIITGGDSSEYEISICSAKVVFNNLDRTKYHPTIINIKKDRWTALIQEKEEVEVDKKDFSIVLESEKRKFHYVFMALHGPPAENGEIQPYFDRLKIPYSSCNAKISSLTFNKEKCNKKLTNLGFKCANSIHITKKDKVDPENIINTLGLPCFIKPNQSGSSLGISKVQRKEDILNAIQNAFIHDNTVLIEEFIDGKEFSCGVTEINSKLTAFPVTEIISENEFFDFEAKYKGYSEEITPARISNNLSKEIQEISKNIFKKMDLKGVCRIDFIVQNQEVYIIEINTIPGLSEESIIPKQVKEQGISLNDFFNTWIDNTLNK